MKIINALDSDIIQKYPEFSRQHSQTGEYYFTGDEMKLIELTQCDVLIISIIDLNLSGRKVRAFSQNTYTTTEIKKAMNDILEYDTHDVSLAFEICEQGGLTTAHIFRGQKHGKKFARISITSMEEIPV